jgi:hypothetical protein
MALYGHMGFAMILWLRFAYRVWICRKMKCGRIPFLSGSTGSTGKPAKPVKVMPPVVNICCINISFSGD